MKIEGDYAKDGYALVRELIPRQVADAFMGVLRRRLLPGGVVPAVPAAGRDAGSAGGNGDGNGNAPDAIADAP